MDPSSEAWRQAALKLMQKAGPDQSTVESLLVKAGDPDYWRSLNPKLTVGDLTADRGDQPLTEQALADCVSGIRTLGYFRLPSRIPSVEIDALAATVNTVIAQGWPPAFAFVYDQFWRALRFQPLLQLLAASLGPDYRQNSNIWIHFVHPKRNSAGWSPHVDGPLEGSRLSVWIPLSDATLDNGCMYLVPRDRFPRDIAERFSPGSTFTLLEVKSLLQASYALPAEKGSVLGWELDILHWGATCTGAYPPRISMAIEFLAQDAKVSKSELPLFRLSDELPTFVERLHAIAGSVQQYVPFEPAMARFRELAQRVRATSAADAK